MQLDDVQRVCTELQYAIPSYELIVLTYCVIDRVIIGTIYIFLCKSISDWANRQSCLNSSENNSEYFG